MNHKLKKKKKSHWDVKAETQTEINVMFSTILSTLNKISDSNAYLFSDAWKRCTNEAVCEKSNENIFPTDLVNMTYEKKLKEPESMGLSS